MACHQPGWAAAALRVARTAAAALVGLAAAAGGLVALSTGAGAYQVQSAKDQVAALEAKVVPAARRVHSWAVRYSADVAEATAMRAGAAVSKNALALIIPQVRRTRGILQQEAVLAYTNVLPDVATPGPHPATQSEQIDGPTYQQVAFGAISRALSSYRTVEATARAAFTTYERRLRSAEKAARAAGIARARALAEAVSLQAVLDRAQRRLARLQTAAQRASTGLPVGDGLVRAIKGQLNGPRRPASSDPAPTSTSAPSITTTSSPTPASRPAPTSVPTSVPTSAPTSVPTSAPTSVPTSTTAPPAAATIIQRASPPAPSGGTWLELRICESGDNYQANTGNGFYGAYQFSLSTWQGLGYSGRPDLAPYWAQDQAAQRLQATRGWGQWPSCSAALGL